MTQLVIACSLSSTSHSAVLAGRLVDELHCLGSAAELVDLRRTALPFCDDGECYDEPHVAALREKIVDADAVTLAVPVYNFDVGGVARNLIALTGSAWNDKIVGLLGTAGGQRSYMSLIPLANSLMLDFRCVIIPRYVYASRQSFANGRLRDPAIEERLNRLARDLQRYAAALGPVLRGPTPSETVPHSSSAHAVTSPSASTSK